MQSASISTSQSSLISPLISTNVHAFLKAEGRRQKAEGRRQKAEGGRQKAEGGRQKALDKFCEVSS